jgi:hypothetical protein
LTRLLISSAGNAEMGGLVFYQQDSGEIVLRHRVARLPDQKATRTVIRWQQTLQAEGKFQHLPQIVAHCSGEPATQEPWLPFGGYFLSSSMGGKDMVRRAHHHDTAEHAADKGRKIQAQVDARDRQQSRQSAPTPAKEPMQAGARDYPKKFPAQHLRKPGLEADLEQPPLFEAPDYRGSWKLKDMVALITGGDSGIGRAVAVLYAREGADVAIVYLDEHKDAEATKKAVEAEGRRCLFFSGDVGDDAFLVSAV